MKDYIWSEWIKIDDSSMEKPKELEGLGGGDYKYQCGNSKASPDIYKGFYADSWSEDPKSKSRITHYTYKIFVEPSIEEGKEGDLGNSISTQGTDKFRYKLTFKVDGVETCLETTDRDLIKEYLNAK